MLTMPLFGKHRKHSSSRPPHSFHSLASPLSATTLLATDSTINLCAASPPQRQGTTHFYPPPNPNLPYQPYSSPPVAAPAPALGPVQPSPPVLPYNQPVSYPPAPPEDPPKRPSPWQSCVNLSGSLSRTFHDAGDLAYDLHDHVIGSTKLTGLFDAISLKLNDIITSIDDGSFSGLENELVVALMQPVLRGGDAREHARSKDKKTVATTGVVSSNCFAKVYLYANSRLPPHLPPLKLYVI
ncbi:hypothetical protein VTN77DRAFT_6288 [Rasamsonia byssochlamydoides]|uniref:uncharacterized protein n=1 Tax=Rasamsonia byssochlamydoides TaxID=89139 RepID=UPI0037431B32